jgi:hypothetical protein
MTSKERVLATLACGIPDRVPVNYSANPGIDCRLKAHFGLAHDDHEGLLRKLGVDFRSAGPPYTGPKRHPDIPERGVQVDNWGIHRRWVEHESGGYCFALTHQLQDNSPTENVVAMYNTARRFGGYSR